MPMTPEEIYQNFHHGSSGPLSEVVRELRAVVPVYQAVSDRLMALSNGMTSVWSGAAAVESISKAESLVASMHRSVELLDACGGSHDAQTTAFDLAKEQVLPVPPVPEKPAPLDMIKDVLQHGPGAPFERIQTYQDAVTAYNAAAERNLEVMDDYYWSTTDNQNIPDDYPRPELAPGAGENPVSAAADNPVTAVVDRPGWWDTVGDDVIEVDREKTGSGSGSDTDGAGGSGGGAGAAGGGFGGGGGGFGGGGGGGTVNGLDAGTGPDFDEPGGGPGGDGLVDPLTPPPDEPGPDVPTSHWPSPDPLPEEPPNPRLIGPPGPGLPPGVVPPGPSGVGWDGDPGVTYTSGVAPVTGAFGPSATGAPSTTGSPSALGPNWGGGGDQFVAGGQPGQPGQGSGAGGRPAGGATGPAVPGVPGSAGRPGGPGGFGGMAPTAARREEDEEHTRPEYLFEPDPNEIFGADQRASSPVIGAAWQPERFDDDED